MEETENIWLYVVGKPSDHIEKDRIMVYDCIPFFNEIDILNLRLHILSPLVDKFIIEEATVTFLGEPKELCFEKNKELFKEFLPKIEYIVVDNSPSELTTHERDKFQKNALIAGLKDAKDEDVIILSDVDEIPNPKALEEIISHFDTDKVYHLAQRMFYCYLNMEEVSGKLLSTTGEFPGVERKMWLGTKVFSKKNIPENGIIFLREASTTAPEAVRVADGGWHFGYMGSRGGDISKRIGDKVVAAAHQEYNDQDTLAEAKDRLLLGQDIFGRDARFERVEIDGSYPEYLLTHLDEYRHLVIEPISKGRQTFIRIFMRIKRFFRKAVRKIRRSFRSKV
ncbi:MAG: glycosyltransferase [Lachnospiraceae bacterium]|nr:glycosyltransferase [Lachnospiraceae bacterium]